MALSFSCPACRTLVQVGDELAGQTGQCPRCDRLVIIPSSQQPMPILLDAAGRPVPMPKQEPRSGPAKALPIDAEEDRPRRVRPPIEAPPKGPRWPWLIGVVCGIAVFVLLFSSLLSLFLYRPRDTRPQPMILENRPVKAAPPLDVPQAGAFIGNTAFLKDGLFQVRSTLVADDLFDPQTRSRSKQYEVHLHDDRTYVIDMDSQQIDCVIRIKDLNGGLLRDAWNRADGGASLEFRPNRTGIHTVETSSANAALGAFTLTIRQKGMPKPNVP